MTKLVDVSIIIVNYKVEKELLECIESIKNSRPTISYEIIVVDNDEVKSIEKNLSKKFPNVRYIPNPKNTGWGAGINLGAEKAKGKYLYFLNPDTLVLTPTLDQSLDFYKDHKKAGVVASLILFPNKEPHFPQGSEELTPLKALFVYSVINKYFPNNSVSKKFFYNEVKRDSPFEIEIAPLTASMIPSDLFREVGMFDTNYFLYFEEYDLGRRVRKKGYKNYILPEAKVIHFWESSTKQLSNRNTILEKSRKYYFKKYFGGFSARLVEAFLRRDLRVLVVE